MVMVSTSPAPSRSCPESASSPCASDWRWRTAGWRFSACRDGARACRHHSGSHTGGTVSGDLIRVVVADDHAVVRSGLKAVLGSARDIEVVAEAGSGREAIAAVNRFHPDVVLMDLTMADTDGLTATKTIT